MSVDTGIKAVSYSSVILPLLLIWVYPQFGTRLKLLVVVAGQICALVPFLWRCSQSTDSEEGFFLFEWKNRLHAGLFKLMYLLLTYCQFPDRQCIPCSAGCAGSCAGTHNSSKELLTFCLGPMDGWSQKTHQTCHSHPWGEPGCLGLPLSYC